MMDIDDGYILWTGIWKGMPFKPPSQCKLLNQTFHTVALGNSKGTTNRIARATILIDH